MGKKLRLTVVAFLLSFVMLMLAVPQVLWVEAAEAIKEMDIVTIREKVDNLPDIDARIDFESLTIIEEDDARRTLNSKEYILSNHAYIFSKSISGHLSYIYTIDGNFTGIYIVETWY